MKKRTTRRTSTKRRTASGDAQLREFEQKDLGADLRAAGTAKVLRPRSRPTSILLDDDLVEALRQKGAKRGLGYQTMLKLIVREHLADY